KLQKQRCWNLGLMNDDRARLQYTRTSAAGISQKTVFIAVRFRQIQTTDNTKCTISNYAPFDLTGGLLRADQNHTQTTTTLGDVQENLFNRTPALARCIFVQFVQNNKHERARRSGGFL